MVDKKLNYAEYQAHEKNLHIGKRYLNLFHQLHVIKAGLTALNKDFISLPDEVIEVLPELAGGAKFHQHIKNLKEGVTPIDKISPDLLPFGKEVFEDKSLYKQYTGFDYDERIVVKSSSDDLSTTFQPKVEMSSSSDNNSIFNLLRKFQATPQFLQQFKSDETVIELGGDWKVGIKNLIQSSDESDKNILSSNFENLCVFDEALGVWQECSAFITNPKSKSKEEIRANLDKYKKYLSMFGQSGVDLYNKIEETLK